jgi:hypothetical protein
MIKIEPEEPILITKVEELESDENGNIHTKYEAVD